jgi:pimeloyl-ACP methyl ester carboxylesterase
MRISLPPAMLSGRQEQNTATPHSSDRDDHSALKLSRLRKFKSNSDTESEIDEAAIALIEMSSLTYFSEARLHATSVELGSKLKLTAFGDGKASNPKAIAIAHHDCVLISFRGTACINDILIDLCFWPALRWPLRHFGFDSRWKSLEKQILDWLATQEQQLGKKPTLYLSGHSLGGAVATIAAIELAKSFEIARVVTIGSPRVGTSLFARRYKQTPAARNTYYNSLYFSDITTRLVHGGDLVTWVPPWPLFQHVAPRVWLRSGDKIISGEYVSNSKFTQYQAVQPIPPPLTLQNPNLKQFTTSDLRGIIRQLASLAQPFLSNFPLIRLAIMFMPITLETSAAFGLHHLSARYLEFMPPTQIGLAMKRTLDPAK